MLGAGGPAASQLSAMLLGSLNGTAPEQLLLVLDGALHRVPFAALPYGVTGERLVQRTIPTVASSLGVARTLSSYRPIAGRALLVSDGRPKPLEALVALPGADSEVERLRHIYPDAVVLTNAAATPAAVMKAAETSAVIHITAHGIANAAHPSRSRIELADDGVEHELRPGNITAAVLSKHPVVILSSCDTGAGRTFRGEGQMNLGRPFLAAGASAVVAAQWNLDDASAPAMVSAMHTRLRDGTPVAAAVAQVQRDAIQKGLPTQVWATFVVLGGAMPPRK